MTEPRYVWILTYVFYQDVDILHVYDNPETATLAHPELTLLSNSPDQYTAPDPQYPDKDHTIYYNLQRHTVTEWTTP